MKSRFLVAAALAFCAGPVAAQAEKAKGPAITAQAAPLGKLLDEVKSIVRTVAGDGPVKQIEEAIKEGLGEKGFAGVDLLRQPAGYANLDKIKDLENFKDASGVLLVPVTGEKEFIDFLKRMKLDVEAVDGKDGLYRIDPRDEPAPFPVRLRFADKYAHIGLNLPDDGLAADKLVPAAKLIDPAERGLFAYTTYYDRMPKALLEMYGKQMEQMTEMLKQQAGVPPAMLDAVKSFSKFNEQMYTEGEVAVVRVFHDPATAEIGYETTLKAKPNTPLAKIVADRKPATNRFAGLVGDATAAGLVLQLPTFTREIRDLIGTSLEEARKQAARDAPEEYRAAIDEGLAGLIRSAKAGELDLAVSLNGPDKDDTFTVVAGVSFDDPSKLEKELRALHKDAPEEIRNMIKLDDAKVGEVSIHRMAIGTFLPEEAKAVFGDKASVCVAFAPKGITITFGPQALDAIKTAIATKPADAKPFDLVANPARVQKLVAAINPQAGEMAAKALGTEDQRLSALSLSVEGGTELRMRFTMSLKVIPKAIVQGVTSYRAPQLQP